VDPDRLRLLRRAAVPRSLTAELMPIIAADTSPGAPALADLPFLEQASWDPSGKTYVVDAGIRDALLADGATHPEELSSLNADLARHFRDNGDGLNALFHGLSVAEERREALAEMERQIDACLRYADVAGAHDLLRLLKEHPLRSSAVPPADLDHLIRDLTPRITRRARWLREREETRMYHRRGFEDAAWKQLEDGPQWLLEIHAPGGYGKTMFVQSLISRTCVDREIPVARIDFDYVAHLVSASNQPWRLLLLVARQLTDQMPGDPFGRLLASWGHFETRTIRRRRHDPAARVPRDIEETRGGEEVPRLFRTILAEWKNPVVIALDTLENLLHAEGATLRSVIDALAEVHEDVPGLRVVLAGRFELGSKVNGQERVPGFHKAYLHPNGKRFDLAGAKLRLGRAATTLSISTFSNRDARQYLVSARGLASKDERVDAIVEKCGGNPMKLAMLADSVKGDNPPSADEIRRFSSTELFYLVDRVIDRIADPRVQWLLRWGTIPQVLPREFAAEVLWPMLEDHVRGVRIWDDPTRDSLATMGRGMARYELADPALDFDQTWKKLVSYSGEASWVGPVSDLPDTLRFHPEVRDPIRGLLLREQQAIYHEASRRALAYWRLRASATSGHARQRALCAAVFHALEPFEGRPGTPASLFEELLADAGSDLTLRVALAREVIDVERRAARADREDLPPPPLGVLAGAHAELAQKAFEDVLAGRPALAELEHHLARSNLSGARRAALEGEARLALGDADAAERLLASAMDRSAELDAPTRLSTAVRLGELRGDVEALASLVRATEGSPEWRDAAAALAWELERAEQFEQARELHEKLDDVVGMARCLLGLGEIAAARVVLDGTPGPEADLVRAELYLASYDPGSVLDMWRLSGGDSRDSRDPPPAWGGLRARAENMLGRITESYGVLESVTAGHASLEFADALTAARIFLDGDKPIDALRMLRTLPPRSPREVVARAAVLRAEAEARCGRAREAVTALEQIPLAGLPLSVRVEAEITRLQIDGLEARSALGLVELIEEAPSRRRRLMLLGGLSRVPTPRDHRSDLRRLAEATSLLSKTGKFADEAPPLVLAGVEILRLAIYHPRAFDVLERFVQIADERNYPPAITRYVLLCLDRLRTPLETLPQRMRAQLARLAGRAPLVLEELLVRDQADRARGMPPGLQGVGPLGLDPEIERLHRLVSSAEPVVAFLEPVEGPWMLTAVAKMPIEVSVWSDPDAREAPYRLLPDPVPACTALGEQMQTWIPTTMAREVVVLLGHESHAWVPWQLAMAPSGQSLVASLNLRCIRRATGPTPGPAGSDDVLLVGSAAVIVLSKGEHPLALRRLRGSYMGSRADFRSETSWRAWPELLEKAPVIHVVGQFEERRGGALVLDLCRDQSSATGSKHLAHALANRKVPSLVILEVPWPGSETEAARQLVMRERFAWEVLRDHAGANVLCIGFTDYPEATGDEMKDLHALLFGQKMPLESIVGRLQAMTTPPRSFGDLLARASATLYSNTPWLRCEP
jgi:hypothetical protein